MDLTSLEFLVGNNLGIQKTIGSQNRCFVIERRYFPGMKNEQVFFYILSKLSDFSFPNLQNGNNNSCPASHGFDVEIKVKTEH